MPGNCFGNQHACRPVPLFANQGCAPLECWERQKPHTAPAPCAEARLRSGPAGAGQPRRRFGQAMAGPGGPRRHGYPLGRLLQLQRRTAPAVARRPLGLAPARAQPARALRTTHAGDHPQSRCCRRQSRWALASGGLHFGRHPLRLGRHATRRHARVKALQWCRRPANSTRPPTPAAASALQVMIPQGALPTPGEVGCAPETARQ